MNAETKFAKEIEAELLKDSTPKWVPPSVPGTVRGEVTSAMTLLASIGNDVVTLQKALVSMASAIEKMQAGLKEAHEMIGKAAGRL